ncbi:23S rRNA (guanosine(2251)-2'-O)-methyltransferase RlmB [Ferrovum sp. PN-J185]|uniref:23S rRNA (guanosine(2251)-2'-O)-methyltransferase RlmB n=1 Tax=Ferrovum sp. PN-J185 TaxID=1356306 RepID=UPI00079BB49B|nr:23S rRNA (guanosine(2251)-2'-O)-methyltransferase RlmB [Ferrovum sp. PN-J185]KXW56967.1 23S rRNA (guanosine-2'-O-)-methyltransferase RlmB [Ferrovum sp. PN-J185]MCC6069160.1 23S rRNA (guanosine(2251)-2'-O)-methyltransferase RlmB [Ferrovum sp. PN-J185]
MKKTAIIYGFHAIKSRLRHYPDTLQEIYVDQERHDQRMQDIKALLEEKSIEFKHVDVQRLHGLTGTRRHQGIVAIASAVPLINDIDHLVDTYQNNLLLLVLDGIQDPHNLGACLRVADAMGVHAIIAPKDRSVALSPTVAKVASGAMDMVPYIPVTNLARTLRDLKDQQVWVIGTDDQAKDDIMNASFSQPLAWVLGAEGEGLRRLTRETCDQLVRIPMFGSVESLNVSVAAGVCLYETKRREKSVV